MKVRCINSDQLPIGEDGFLTIGKIYEVIKEDKYSYKVITNNSRQVLYNKNRFEIVKEENKMEKTFKEVIADIKEGETWIQKDKGYIVSKIANFGGDIVIELDSLRRSFGTKGIYVLERKEYSFIEAFKAYEEGKEIESCEYRYKIIDGKDMYSEKDYDDWDILFPEDESFVSFNEIRGKWYINERK